MLLSLQQPKKKHTMLQASREEIMSRRKGWGFILLFSLASLGELAQAQIRSGTIVGTVVDPSGAPVPDARVTVVSQQTNATFETTTRTTGQYTAPYLQLGQYTVTVSKEGFASARVTDVSVTTAATARVDISLELSRVATTVEIQASAIGLQTESSGVQNVTDERVIATVPNITNNPFYFATLQAGVVPRTGVNQSQGVNNFGIGIDGRRTFSALSINGGQAFTNDIQLDGVSVQGSAWNEAAVLPNPDGIQEVRTLINNFSAEYGRAQGVVQITTKSGTNELHGSAFWRTRNEAFNANSFSDNSRGIPRGPFKVHYYGGTAGGPVVKNRAFFFGSYEGMQHSRAIDYLRTVPTVRERIGDFSQTLVFGQGGAPVRPEIYDPFSAAPVAGQTNVYERTPFPNAAIPASRLNPHIREFFSFYPEANRAPEDFTNRNNFFRRTSQNFDRNSVNTRFDWKVKQAWSLYWTGGINRGAIITPRSWSDDNPFYSRGPFIGNRNEDDNPYASLGNTIIINPSTIADFRIGLNRINARNQIDTFEDFDYGRFGIGPELVAINPVPGAPPEFQAGGNLSSLSQTGSLHKVERQTNWNLVASLTKIVNRWNLKFGSEYRSFYSNYIDAENSFSVRSSRDDTRRLVRADGVGIGAVEPQEGYQPASLLAGAGFLRMPGGRGVRPAFAQKYFALYSQSDWRATNSLTLNFGLRWEVQPGPTDRFNRLSAFDSEGTNTYGGEGGWHFAGVGGYPRNAYETNWRDFGPRVGFAYRMTEKLVVRGGYGLTYVPTNTGYFDGPFTYGMDSFDTYLSENVFGTNPNGIPAGPFNSLNQVNNIIRGTGSDPNPANLYGVSSFRFPFRAYRNGRTQQMNLFLERRLGNEWLVSAGWTRSKGDHLAFARLPVNHVQQLPESLLAGWREQYISRNGTGHPGTDRVPNPFQPDPRNLIPLQRGWGNATVPLIDTLLPYPLFNAVQLQSSRGFSDYHALQFRVHRNLAQGLQLSAHYTWSKSLDATQSEAMTNGFADTGGYVGQGVDLRNFGQNRKLSLTDVPHRFVAAYVYELPMGRGKALNPGNPVTNALVGGWRIGGVTTFQSGFPRQIGGGTGGMNGRPDRVSGVAIEVPKELQGWYDGRTAVTLPSGRQVTPCNRCFLKYNIDAFRAPVVQLPNGRYANDIFWYGSSAYTFSDFRGRGLNNWNLTVARTFRATERLTLDFSAQATNAFNHTQFNPNINGGIGSTSLGTAAQNIEPGMGTNGSFGTYTDNTFDARQIMFELKFRF